MIHSPVHLCGAGAIGTASGARETPQVAFAEATGSCGRTSCIHILLIQAPNRHYHVERAKVKAKETVKGGRTGIFQFGLTDESVVRKAFLANECEACVW